LEESPKSKDATYQQPLQCRRSRLAFHDTYAVGLGTERRAAAAQDQRHTRVPQVGLHNRREIKRECKGLKLVRTAVFGVDIHGLNAGAAS